MAGVYWLTILPDTSKLRPAILAAMNGVEIKPDFGVDKDKARKAAKEAAKTMGDELDKSTDTKVKPKADKPTSQRAGQEAGKTVSGAFSAAANGDKLGTDVGGKFAAGLKRSLSVVGPMLAGASVFGGLTASLSEGMDFTAQLNALGGVAQATGDQLAAVSAKARQLGQDATLPGVSATTAATAMTELAKGGFSVAQSMEAARGTLQLAGAAAIDAGSAATIQSDALHMFGLEATDANRVADLLANSANASTSEIPQMAQALAQAGSAANGFGISIEDTLTSLAMFSNFGIKGSDAGTLMKSSLIAITDGGKPATDAINALGLELYNAQGQFVGYPEMLRQVADASTRMTQEQFQGASAVLFGSDAMRGAMVAAKGGADAFAEVSDKVRNGAGAAAMAESRMKGLPGAWAQFKNTLDGVKLAVYDLVQGPLTGLLNALSGLPEFVSRNKGAFAAVAAVIGTVAVPALTLWIAAQAKALALSVATGVGSLVGAWATLASGIANAAAAAGTFVVAMARAVAASVVAGLQTMVAAIRSLAIGTRLAAAAQLALNIAMTANPIGLIIAAVVAVGVALWAFFTKTETGRKMWAVIWDSIKTIAGTVFDFLKTAVQFVGDKIMWLWQNVAVPAFQAIKGAVTGFWDTVRPIWDLLVAAFDRVAEKVGRVKDAFSDAFNGIRNIVSDVWDSIGGIFDKITGGISSAANLLGGRADGGPVGYAGGGRISGPGSGRSDSILGFPAMVAVSNGEYVVNAGATSRYLPLLNAINYGAIPGFADGGHVTSQQLVQFASGVEGKPYVWGGVNWGDCSGAVSAVANYATGRKPFGSRFATGSMGRSLELRGFKPGIGPSGSLSVGWYNGGKQGGHAAATLPDGTNFEMGGQRGNGQFGGGAAGAGDSMFTKQMHLPPEWFTGLDGGAPTTGGDGGGAGSGSSSGGSSSSGGGGGGGGAGGGGGGGAFSGIGQTAMSGVMETLGLDGSVFGNPLELPNVKSVLAGLNFAGGLLGKATGGGGADPTGGLLSGLADSFGLGGFMSLIPKPAADAIAATDASSVAPAAHTGTGATPGPVDNSINFNGNVGMSPGAVENKVMSVQTARTRTTQVR